jgi:protein associated with RNAse G/E
MGQLATINSRRYDGSIKRSWKCELISRDNELLTFQGVFDLEVVHPDLGIIKKGTISHEYYWLERWYNIFRFCEPDGTFRNYYCNINMPPVFKNGSLDYVDLDIDLVVWPDGTVVILDEDDYLRNSIEFGYPETVVSLVNKAIEELKQLIEDGQLPVPAL